MNSLCYIFNTKLSAWFGQSGVYTSNVKEAKQVSEADAIKFCKSRFESGLCFPVPAYLIEAVMKK